ncbi:MAG: PEP-utilizing enzyme [Gemmatimonadota bacterium]|nr:PEP-utilizing enzyme [Gemmatimonadota bacterium]
MSEPSEIRLPGRAAAPGKASGPVHLVNEASLHQPVPTGCILVTRILHPHQAPLLARVAGIVTEEGSLLQHATALAREFGVPAVVGVRGATAQCREGDRIEVDGDLGVVILVSGR